MEATNLADLYHSPLLDWSGIEARLREGLSQVPGTGGPNRHTCWLATINPDGSPHVTGIGALWTDGCFWFETGTGTRKGRNLARDPRCTLSVAAQEFDLVVAGEATLVTDPAPVADLAARWAAEGWPARADDTGLALTAAYNAPSARPPPWHAGHPRGPCTASRRARRQRWAPSIPEARRGGGSSRTGPWQRIESASAARCHRTRRTALGRPSADAQREGARPADLARRPGDRRRV